MPDKAPLLQSIRLKNLLSFGSAGVELELRPLNVLIGPNGSGKSNLIEAISLLQAAPTDLLRPIREGGGVREWLWKGAKEVPTAEITMTVDYPAGGAPLRHHLAFTMAGHRLELTDETVESTRCEEGEQEKVRFLYRNEQGRPVFNVRDEVGAAPGSGRGRKVRQLQSDEAASAQSALSQRKDPDGYPELTYLAEQYSGIGIFREWAFGRHAALRQPQYTDLPGDYPLESFSNLAIVLNDLEHRSVDKEINKKLNLVSKSIQKVSVRIIGGTAQIYFHEGLSEPISAMRASDGMLHFLALVVLLCHPEPPPVLCIEEPELGLHPDLIPEVADMLLDASTRTQLFVTTHSETLVDALTDTPESVIICEKEAGETRLRRLEWGDLRHWLKDHGLGNLWRSGQLGGNRW
ncbi:MAG: AAA family ATPase [Chloroflexi bacterium]|nr:AAA family ATPase [Chloroflexota bacterium]